MRDFWNADSMPRPELGASHNCVQCVKIRSALHVIYAFFLIICYLIKKEGHLSGSVG